LAAIAMLAMPACSHEPRLDEAAAPKSNFAAAESARGGAWSPGAKPAASGDPAGGEYGPADINGSQVPRRRLDSAPGDDAAWAPFDGSEQVIVSDLSVLTDGALVQIAPAPVAHDGEQSALRNGVK
jgi:hypothetical protein